jgi:hypothetical protein
MARYLSRHPDKVPAVLRAGWRLRANHWWQHAPYLPMPGESYGQFRMITATGSSSGTLSAREVVDAATWSLRQREGR